MYPDQENGRSACEGSFLAISSFSSVDLARKSASVIANTDEMSQKSLLISPEFALWEAICCNGVQALPQLTASIRVSGRLPTQHLSLYLKEEHAQQLNVPYHSRSALARELGDFVWRPNSLRGRVAS